MEILRQMPQRRKTEAKTEAITEAKDDAAEAKTEANDNATDAPEADGAEDTADGGKIGGRICADRSGIRLERCRDHVHPDIRRRKIQIPLSFTSQMHSKKQENQIKAIKSFIEQGVDVIGLAPVVETGWDQVFAEAQDAGIPVVLLDRRADVSEDLYTTFIGSDFIEEGKMAAQEMAKLIGEEGKIVELEGTVGASAATDRKTGFDEEMAANYPNIEIVASQTGDFTRAQGKEVMESFLKSNEDIKGVYAHNDDMALGAIEAIKEAGLKPGEDIKGCLCGRRKGYL